jgi:hypothetical protein
MRPTIASVTLWVIDPVVAEMFVEPSETPVVRPVWLPTVATAGALDVHLARAPTSPVVPSE